MIFCGLTREGLVEFDGDNVRSIRWAATCCRYRTRGSDKHAVTATRFQDLVRPGAYRPRGQEARHAGARVVRATRLSFKRG